MSRKLTTEEFIERAKKVHGDKYDYSKVEYINAVTKICIICPNHGEFWQMPYSHLDGIGCKGCGHEKNSNNRRKTTDGFIKNAKTIHGDKYDYSKVEYSVNNIKVCIICPKHGEFWQTPNEHLSGHGCPKCAGKHQTTEDVISRFKNIHGNKYNYSKVKYAGAKTKVCIICPEHGEFWQTPNAHLNGKGCAKCQYERNSLLFMSNDFVEKAKEIHRDRYDYSKVEYTGNKKPVCIMCPKHGEFWQTPNHHLRGCGCPICSNSKLEEKTKNLLNDRNIKIIQKCTNSILPWLGKQHLDFYLPEHKAAIECQGEQHFCGWHRKEESLKHIKSLDKKKLELCRDNNVSLYYINYDDNVEERVEMILEAIRI